MNTTPTTPADLSTAANDPLFADSRNPAPVTDKAPASQSAPLSAPAAGAVTSDTSRANPTPTRAPTKYGNSVRRHSSLPVKDLLKSRMKELDIKNIDLQRTLGYPRSNVIAMMKSGSMQLPANKVVDAARLLELDPVFLLGKVVAEKDPELWSVILTLLGRQLVSETEMALVNYARQGLDGHDIDLTREPNFDKVVKPLMEAIVAREVALTLAAVNPANRGAGLASSAGGV